jgi:hypothetical protein
LSGDQNLSALLIDLSGLQFGSALLSARGIPDRDKIECFAADFALQRGELQTRTLLLDTTSDITSGSGAIKLRTETLDYQIKTESKHFTIGALAAPISITGSFKDPGALPDITKLAVRGAVAAGLGVLLLPTAILRRRRRSSARDAFAPLQIVADTPASPRLSTPNPDRMGRVVCRAHRHACASPSGSYTMPTGTDRPCRQA